MARIAKKIKAREEYDSERQREREREEGVRKSLTEASEIKQAHAL